MLHKETQSSKLFPMNKWIMTILFSWAWKDHLHTQPWSNRIPNKNRARTRKKSSDHNNRHD